MICVLCLGGQILTLAHEATERHVRCAEHGELSHLGVASRGHASSASAEDQPPEDHRAPGVAGQADPAVVTHEHCAFLAAEKRAQSQPILRIARAPEPAAVPPLPRATPILAPVTERVLLSAPKMAPPRISLSFC